jgi:hypothetical protein
LDLDNKIWTTLNGGYKIPYDASIQLKQLRKVDTKDLMIPIFEELWEELHHQGDVELASYYSVPQLISICIDKKSLDYNFIGLCVTIEICRLSETNPIIPKELEQEYFDSLKEFQLYLISNFDNITDDTSLRLTLAFFAITKGQHDLGKAIDNLDEDVLKEFLVQF